MKGSKYWKDYKGALSENKLNRYILIGSVIVNVILAIGLASKTTTVVMQPPLLQEEGWIARSDASMSMKESWGMYIATLLGNTTPRTVSGLTPALGKIVAPGVYGQIMQQLADLKKEVQTEQLEVQFSPSGVFLLPQRDIVAVTGELRMRSSRGIEKKYVRTYEIGLRFRDYKPTMTSLEFYEGQLKRAPKE
jgi:conjugal transfer pilus assembly protein TraE